MGNKFSALVFFFLAAMFCQLGVGGQTFFKILEGADQFFNQKIARFPNGDLLIGDSSLESLSNGGNNGQVFMSRLDPCGNVVWSYSYILPEGHLEFKDCKINDGGDVFAYGSYYQGLDELIFLLKIDGNTGKNGDYKLWYPGTVDHFTYSLDLKDGLVMMYGLLLGFNTQKQGFVAVFNEGLGFLWAKKFAPFESSGSAVITSDNGFIGRSGKHLIKLDAGGELQWASLLEAGPNTNPVSGPLEVSGGYIMEAHREGMSFFYKINTNGQLIWTSDFFPATKGGVAMSLLPDGNVLCTYNCPSAESNRLCQLMLAPDGRLFDQRELLFGQTLNPGRIYQSLNTDQTITIAGNVDPFGAQTADIADFLLQFPLDPLPDDCMFWENFQTTIPNDLPTVLTFYDFDPIPFDMVLEQSIRTDTTAFLLPLTELCGETFGPELLRQDTMLPCGIDWTIFLPGADFVWTDGTPGRSRVISLPGTYQAGNRSCTNPIVLSYTLAKEACGCQVYLPNAFSPNDDGINDRLEFFSDCTLNEIELSVFNRWGSRLFYSTTPGHFWDGTHRQKKMPAGVYVVMLKYQWTDFDGQVRQGALAQDVTVLP